MLRQLTADFMRQNPDEFMPFIDVEDGIVTQGKEQEMILFALIKNKK